METIKTREEISPQDQWDLSSFFPSLQEWQKEFKEFSSTSPLWKELLGFKGRLKESAAVLAEAIALKLKIERSLEKLYTYAHLRHDEEITKIAYKEEYERAHSLLIEFNRLFAWFEPELLEIDPKVMEEWVKSRELLPYAFYLNKILRMRPHILSPDREELLAMAAKPLKAISKAFSALNNADLQFPKILDSQGKEHPLTHGLYQVYLRHEDRVLRKNAFMAMHKAFELHENTLTELIAGEMQTHHFSAQARGFSSSLEAALFPHAIPPSVYRALIHSVKSALPALHRYVKVKKEILGLSEIHLYDLYMPLAKSVEKKYGYEEAEALVIDSVAPLGEEYQKKLEKGLKKEKWVDRLENKHKRSGAYSSGCYDSAPYILLNFRGTSRDLFTLAHEAGHSMHSLLSKEQPYQDASYPIFLAEVASTFNEELLVDLLLKRVESEEEKLALLSDRIEDIRATFFRQVMFAEFELLLHEWTEQGKPLTPAYLKEIYLQLNRDYFGPALTLDEEASIEWARIPHFYYNFYVYQYATGISAALALVEQVLDKGEATSYLHFLKSGGKAFPLDLLKKAGVNMETPQPIESTIRHFEKLLSYFKK